MVYLAAAMIALWALVTIYIVYVSLRQRSLENELATLEETVKQNKQS